MNPEKEDKFLDCDKMILNKGLSTKKLVVGEAWGCGLGGDLVEG